VPAALQALREAQGLLARLELLEARVLPELRAIPGSLGRLERPGKLALLGLLDRRG